MTLLTQLTYGNYINEDGFDVEPFVVVYGGTVYYLIWETATGIYGEGEYVLNTYTLDEATKDDISGREMWTVNLQEYEGERQERIKQLAYDLYGEDKVKEWKWFQATSDFELVVELG